MSVPNNIGGANRGKSVIHIAGKTGADGFLRCTRCARILQDHRPISWEQLLALPYSVYPEGSFIEVGPGFQSMTLDLDAAPTCAIDREEWLRVAAQAVEDVFIGGAL